MIKKQKGFLITLDAMLGVGMLLLVVILLSTEWFRPLTPDGLYLKQVSLDTLNLMESAGILDRVMSGNQSSARELFEKLPSSVCMRLTILNSKTDENITTISRVGCEEYGKELQVAYGNFVYDKKRYTLELESWYKKE